MVELDERELLMRLRNPEDNFVERKLFSDSSDWLKTAVAFANSTPIDYPAVLFIGVNDNGVPEGRRENLDSIQKKITEKIGNAYPPIYHCAKIINVDGRDVLAIIIPGSRERPHFSGPSFVRKGPETVRASEEQFERLMAERNAKAYEVLKWVGKMVTVDFVRSTMMGPVPASLESLLLDCNRLYVTLESGGKSHCYPLARVEVSFDPERKRLKLEAHPL